MHAGDRRRAVLQRRFNDRPLLVFWEMTKACDLACLHCRADAQHQPAPDELTTAEGRRMIDDLAALEAPRPIVILTGGDCLKRADLIELIDHAKASSLPVALAPSVTPLLTTERMREVDHPFYVYLDGSTNLVNIVYERKAGGVGNIVALPEGVSAPPS